MPAPRGKLTDLPELGAYVLAHALGLAWGIAANPLIFRSLVAQGYRDHLLMFGIAMSAVVSIVVLLIFLGLRKLFAGAATAPPPPAAPPVPPPKFTDVPELAAYVLAHAAGIAWGATVTPLIFRSLIAQGHPPYSLALVGFSMSIAVSIVVLLIFLFLRKAMAGPGAPA
jgi:hypothetical protein